MSVPRRPLRLYFRFPRPRRRPRPAYRSTHPRRTVALLILAGILVGLVPISLYLRRISSAMALSDAIDLVTLVINDTIHEKLQEGDYSYDYFVTLEKDQSGQVTAITTNMSRINSLSSELLRSIVDQSGNTALVTNIPLGNLLGLNLLSGKGPDVPVEILMLTSSRADFRNDLSAAGINQTRHQIILELVVDIDVLVPWDMLSTQVVSEVLVAETVIVGQVPERYLEVN